MNTFTTKSKLVSVLYSLLRDHLSPGVIEGLVQEVEHASPEMEYVLSNGYLGEYAQDIADRLRE